MFLMNVFGTLKKKKEKVKSCCWYIEVKAFIAPLDNLFLSPRLSVGFNTVGFALW